VVDLSSGNPDEQLLPDLDALAKAAEPVPVLYGEPHVVPSFSAAFEDYLRSEGLRAQAMIPLPGGLFAVEFVLSTLLEPGSRVAVESPGHQGDVLLLRSLGLVEVPVRVDRHGMIPEDLDAVVAGLDAVLLRPRAQNPTGAALSEERAAEVGRVLADRDVLVVAEDHCGPVSGVPFRSPAAPGHALALTIHSFSKWIGPDLRCAVVTGDAFLIDVLGRRRLLGGGWVSRRTQALIAAALTDPAARELRQVARETYAARRNALVEALAAHAIVGTGDSGLNVYVRVPDERRVAEHLARSGWLVGTGACHGGREDALRLTVAALPATDAKQLAEHVAEAVIRDARS
jgi:DNA-binding transcriptional MocR family regulator